MYCEGTFKIALDVTIHEQTRARRMITQDKDTQISIVENVTISNVEGCAMLRGDSTPIVRLDGAVEHCGMCVRIGNQYTSLGVPVDFTSGQCCR
jgi:hypothetical protein